ncbi:MAG: lysozyme [Wohlfahrtiimonas sp.]
MKTDKKGIELIKEFEGCKLKAYQDSVGVWTIGYGHTKGVKKGDVITQDQANQFLIEDLADAENAVNRLVEVEINQDMFDALVSFTYNLGSGNLSKSTLLRLLNQGRYSEASDQFLIWNKAGGVVLNGLVRRRKAEQKLFRSGKE